MARKPNSGVPPERRLNRKTSGGSEQTGKDSTGAGKRSFSESPKPYNSEKKEFTPKRGPKKDTESFRKEPGRERSYSDRGKSGEAPRNRPGKDSGSYGKGPERERTEKRPFSDRPKWGSKTDDKKDFSPRKRIEKDSNSFGKGPERERTEKRPFSDRPKWGSKTDDKKDFSPRKRIEKDSDSYEKAPEGESSEKRPYSDREKRPYADREKRPYADREKRPYADREKRPYSDREQGGNKTDDKKDFTPRRRVEKDSDSFEKGPEKEKGVGRPWKRDESYQVGDVPETPAFFKSTKAKVTFRKRAAKVTLEQQDGKIRLNKYVANAGICSRREADDLIKSGVIKVNGVIVTEMGFRVSPSDQIQYAEQTLSRESKRYLLLNKPKDYITTSDDPEGRKTVMELIHNACRERLYPVGRLDRATTGLLLMTNDGELAKRLTHPSHEVRKVYHVTLDKNLKAVDLKRIAEGITLEDGQAEVDEISWIGEETAKNEVGVVLHSGKNRIVRRIFEHLGYAVTKLDRTYFAGLTKKNLARGKFRFLTEKEITLLKMS